MKHRLLLFLMLFLVMSLTMKASPVDERTAREVGFKFMNANAKTPMRGINDLQLVTTYNISRGDAAFYVFNIPNGFVIVSATDCATPILGYSEEGQFDMEGIPVQMQDYLQDFVDQIQYGIENHIEVDEQTARQWELVRTVGRLTNNRSNRTVEPLITAMWDQGCYYNEKCPEDMFGMCGHAVTGCVATAMAQIMHYWGYPENGAYSNSYIPLDPNTDEPSGYPEQSVDFWATTYDWDNMPNQLDGSNTYEQIEAVATLMWHCGVSVNMMYSTNESGAYSYLVEYALEDYFNYSDESSYEYKSQFTDASWKAKLKDCLNWGRPVYYSGYTLFFGGHAFVCDGYDNNEMFHFNWGWSGNGNGYFAIGALNVDYYEYNRDNSAIFNIHPQGETTNYVINVSVDNNEGGTASGGGAFAHGDIVTLTAVADEGYGFCYWKENGAIVSTDSNYSFTANYNRDLVAVFAGPFSVTVSAEEGGTASGGGSYYYGEPCLVIASANEGYAFSFWTNNDEVVSYNANYIFPVTGETHLIAHFVSLEGNIIFADGNVKAICVANWDIDGDGMLSYEEAASVTSLGEVFRNKASIYSFDELQFFIDLTSISNYAFYNCRGLTSLTIPNAVTSIGNYAFQYCINLTGSLTIPNSVTSIGDNAFNSCSGLTSLTIGNSVSSISNSAFYNCNNLNSLIVLAETPPILGTDAFKNVSTDIPVFVPCGSVEVYQATEGWSAFPNIIGMCSSGNVTVTADPLEGGTITGGGIFEGGDFCTVNAIPNEGYGFAFWTKNDVVVSNDANYRFVVTGDSQLIAHFISLEENIIFADANVKDLCVSRWDTNGDGELSKFEAATVMSLGTLFNNNTTITTFEELQYFIGLNSIANDAFKNCSELVSFIFPNSVTTIGSSSFSGCTGLASLDFPNSVTTIGSSSFSGCTGLVSLDFPDSMTTIGSSSFSGCTGLVSLILPNSLVEIGGGAFSGCTGLTGSLVIPNLVTTIGNSAFSGCTGLTGSLVIPNSVTTIGNSAFYRCTGLTGSLVIPNSVTTIGSSAFSGCTGLTGSLVIPNSVTTIGSSAFSGCTGFTGSLVIPNSVITIGEHAFRSCNGFTGDLIIPNSVTTIGKNAFEGCRGFTGGLTISNSITTINMGTFYGCSGFTGDLIIPNSVNTIEGSGEYGGYGAFQGCSGFDGNLYIPNSVTTIGESAFSGCRGFTGNLIIPNSVTSIGDYAFNGCRGLTSLTIGNAVTSIGNYAFFDCMGLTSLTIGTSVTSIGYIAFYTCYHLESITVLAETPPSIQDSFRYCPMSIPVYVPCGSVEAYQFAMDWDNFYNIQEGRFDISVSVNLDEGGTVTGTGNYCLGSTCTITATANGGYDFLYWTKNDSVVSDPQSYSFVVSESANYVAHFEAAIVENIIFADANVKAICVANWDTNGDGELSYDEAVAVTSLGQVFRGNIEITSFEELQYFLCLSTISAYAFSGCSGLTSLIIPNSVTSIGSYAFSGCSGLTGDLTIPNSVTSIGNYAFNNCSGLTGNLTISNSVTSIGKYAFSNCGGLVGDLIIPNSVTTIGNYAFYKCSGFNGNLIISNSVSFIGEYAFSNCGNLTGSVTIPNSVTTIGKGAFYYCSSLNGSLIIPNSVTSIGSSAFSGCSSLTGSLTIPNSVTTIEYGTFSGCRGFTGSLVIPNSITSISDYAFSFCIGLTGALTISNSVNSIGNRAFWNCNRLTSMVILTETPPTLGTDAFYNVSTSIPVFVPCGSVEAYQAMDGWNSFTNIMDLCLPGTITVMADPAEGGEVTGSGTYESGTFCTVTATPNEGYRFANWIENGNVVSFDANHSFVVTGESLLTAHFVLDGNIVFADDIVKAICVSNWDTNGDGELSYVEAASVTTLSVINIGEIFSGNTDITSFDELKHFVGLTSIGNNAFRYCSNLMELPTFPSTITSIGNSAFSGCSKMKGLLTLPNGITSIGNSAFSGCSGIIGPLIIPNSVTSIGNSAFYMCSGLTGSITLPDSLTHLGSAFYGCRGLTGSVTIPNTITSIGSTIFYWCDGLTSMTIPNSVTSIGTSAFSNCRGLTSIIILAETPPAVSSPSEAFYGVPTTIPIYVPCESIEAYQASEDWSRFSNFVGMCSSGTVTVAANPVEGGEVTGAGTYESGTTCTVTATSNESYTFMYWTLNGAIASTCAEYTFTIPADCNLVAHFTLPLCITATANLIEGGTVSEGEAYYDYGSLVTLTASASEGFLFNSWKKGGTVVSYFSDYSFIVTENSDFVACFEPAPQGIIIGEHTASNGYLPCNSYSYYSLSQQIYTADEIGMACEISSVSFFNTSETKYLNWDVYLVHTEKNTFDSSTDWIPVTESDLVFSGNVIIRAGCWTTINFDTLFEYDGVSNLALVVDNNTGYWTGSVSLGCQVFNTIGNQSIGIASSTNYDPSSPSNYYGSRWSEKNRVIFGAVASDNQQAHFISAGNWSEASNWSGGTLPEANDEVFIDASCQLDMNATVASLTVSDGQSLTLQSGQTLVVTNVLTNAATTGLVIEDGAQLVHDSENVSAMVKKNIAGHGSSNGKYSIISNPLTTVVDPEMSSVYHLISGDYDLYDWLPSASDRLEWRNFKDNIFVMSHEGYGYLYANRNGVELNFPGILKPSHNRYAKNVSYDSNDTEHPGWNLIGNPFVCNAYLVDEEGAPLPYYRMNATGNGFEAVAPGTPIAPMEGVFYKASGNGTVYFTRIVPSESADKAAKQAKRTVKQNNDDMEHSTLGDLEVLDGLKENLEKQEKAQKGE